jgi:hypothetical protein
MYDYTMLSTNLLVQACHFQPVSNDILQKLEILDKDCDIDDIVNYRTIAEQQLQVLCTFI